ncbi:hypothetical protein CerSpe_267660 [Prunus speciosa]
MEGGDIGDWEMLQNSDPPLVNSDDSVESPRNFEGIDVDAEGMIRPDYFSLDNQGKYGKDVADVSEEGSVESDNPSWIDPGPVTRYGAKEPGGFWSDSGSDRSDGRKSNDFEVKNELGFAGNDKSQVGFGGIVEMEYTDENLGKFGSGKNKLSGLDVEGQLSFEEIGENTRVEKESEMGFSGLDGGNDMDKKPEDGQSVGSQSAAPEVKPEAKSGAEVVKRTILWWKVPFEVLKYCVFRVSPVWSFSVAAAVMGLVFLGRRLYKMKRKSQTLQLKVTLDDKKVSQFMSRAVRLNEAFSVVRRVPIIRPSLPASGVNPWPVMSLR